MGIATEDDIDSWLKDMGLDSLTKTAPGNWNLVYQIGDSTILNQYYVYDRGS